MKNKVRVRFAPSPTGPFSIGNARTALFNWLFARKRGGEFLLRIEDTDRERSHKKYEKGIVESLRWLRLQWDGKIIRQSERLDVYEKYLRKLLQERKAYYCICSPETLEEERKKQKEKGIKPQYSGFCRNAGNTSGVIRFAMPEKRVAFYDLIRRNVAFNASEFGDIVIAKGLREPLYNFAAAVDDAEMGITHVIRGEDHISNTPKQILILEALGLPEPRYAHLPLILGPDKKKLSKRHLDTSLLDYRVQGYLPETMLNFLVLLGWHPERDREIISREDMIKEFSLERVQKGGAVFDRKKLDWLNGYYIRNLDTAILGNLLKPFVPEQWHRNQKLFLSVIEIEKERLKRLGEFSELASFFFESPDYSDRLLIWKEADSRDILKNLNSAVEILRGIPEENFNRECLEQNLMPLADKRGRGVVLWPLRVALSGKEKSPGPFEIAAALGKEESIKRIEIAIKKLKNLLFLNYKTR